VRVIVPVSVVVSVIVRVVLIVPVLNENDPVMLTTQW